MLFKQLYDSGIDNILILTGYLHEQIFQACGDKTEYGQNIYYSRELAPLGTAGALANAKDILCHWTEFILLNGDTYFESSLAQVLDANINDDQMAVISAMYTNDCRRYGRLIFSEDNLLKGFLEKDSNVSSGWVSNGICKLSHKILDFIPKEKFCSLEQDVFPKIIKEGSKIKVAKLSGFFHDIGLPESYAYFNFEQVYTSISRVEIKVLFAALVLKSNLWILDKKKLVNDSNSIFSQSIPLLSNRCNINYISDNNLISEIDFFDVLIISKKQLNRLELNSSFKKLIKNKKVIFIEDITFNFLAELNKNWLKVLEHIEHIEHMPAYKVKEKVNPMADIIEEVL